MHLGPKIANYENTGERRPYSLCIRMAAITLREGNPLKSAAYGDTMYLVRTHRFAHGVVALTCRRTDCYPPSAEQGGRELQNGVPALLARCAQAPALGRGQAAWQGAACGQSTLEIIGKKRPLHAAAESPGVD